MPTSARPTRVRRLAALVATTAALAVLAVAPASPAAAAPGTATGGAGQTLTVSDVDDLDPEGAVVTVTGQGYDIAGFDLATEGMYLALCVDNGSATPPGPCVGGTDTSGAAGASRWLTNNPYPGAPAAPIGADGSFTTELTLQAADANVDCLDLPAGQACKVVTRMDHRSSGDRSQDVKVPVTFAEPAPGPQLTIAPSGGLFAQGQDVVVTGTGYPTTAPGIYVVFGPRPQGNTVSTMYGVQAFVPSSQIAADGSFTVTLGDVEPVYTGGDGAEYDFTDGGGFISTMRAHGRPDVAGEWAVSEPVTFRSRTAAESFVTAAHLDFLGEEPTRAELAADTAALASQPKATYLRHLSTSDAWLAGVVDRLYQDTLGRAGSAEDVLWWSNRIRSGWTVARVAASFYASSEYYAGIGGGTDASWVEDLYEKVLLREAEAEGRDYWVSQIPSRGRGVVALRIFQSSESARTRVTALYDALLGRAPEADGLAHWSKVVVTKGDLALAVNLAHSTEYADRAVTRFP